MLVMSNDRDDAAELPTLKFLECPIATVTNLSSFSHGTAAILHTKKGIKKYEHTSAKKVGQLKITENVQFLKAV